MKYLPDKVKEIMESNGEEIDLFTNMYDDGTSKEPDLVYYRFYAHIDTEYDGKTVEVNLSKEDGDIIFENREIYKFPFINDYNVMERIFAEIVLSRCEAQSQRLTQV